MAARKDIERHLRGLPVLAAATGAAVFTCAWFSLWLTRQTEGVAAVWPVNAIVVAQLWRLRARHWPPILAAAAAGNFLANLMVGNSWAIGLGLSAFNLLEIVLCAAGIHLLIGPRKTLYTQKAFWTLAMLCLGSALPAAAAASTMFWAIDHRDWAHSVALWTASDGLGLLLVTPALHGIDRANLTRLLGPERRWRALAALVGLVAVDLFVFLNVHTPLLFLATGSLILFVFELETFGAAIGLLITAVIGIGCTLAGYGPLVAVAGDRVTPVVALQVFLAFSAMLNLTVAATLAERRVLQGSLAESEALYRMLTERATDIIVRYGATGIVDFASPSVRRLGFTPQEVVGRNIAELTHPDDASLVRRRIEALKSGNLDPDLRQEIRVRCADGRYIWLEGNPAPLRDAGGKLVGYVTALRDVTDRRAAEEATAASEARYRLLAENATDVVATCTPDGLITYASPSAEQVYGYTPAEMIGTNAASLIHPDDQPMVTEHLGAMLRSHDPRARARYEFRAVGKGGRIVWVEANPSVVCDPVSGRVILLQDTLRDISRRKQMEAELASRRAEAEAATVAKSEFLDNMSHEMRTPLTVILGYSGLLEAMDGLPNDVARYVGRIASSSQALLALVNDLLDASRIGAGQVLLDPQPFEPSAMITETVELMSDRATAKGLTVTCRIDGDMPDMVVADEARARQILLNLVSNAVKFTSSGHVEVTARYANGDGGRLHVAVCDTGIGISADRLSKLFQRFSQVDGSIGREFGGSGLGLAIAADLAQLMGGAVGVDSVPGEGSTFWFEIAAPVI